MNDLQQLIYDIARILLWPVLIAAVVCLVWVLIELGVLLYELWLRFRYRDLDALEVRALRARKAFRDGKPRTAYRYLQENNYSLVVVRFLYDLIRNYQTERLAAKPLKLLQEYEFYTIKRLERTRILVRIGPMLGLMGTLIPLAPALVGLASGDVAGALRQPGDRVLRHRHRPAHRRPRLPGQHRARPPVLPGHLGHGVPARAARGLRRAAALRAPPLQDRRLGHRGAGRVRGRRRGRRAHRDHHAAGDAGRAAAARGRHARRQRRLRTGRRAALAGGPRRAGAGRPAGRRRRPHVRRPQHGLEPGRRPVRRPRPRRPGGHGRSQAPRRPAGPCAVAERPCRRTTTTPGCRTSAP